MKKQTHLLLQRTISLVLCAVMLLAVLPASVFTAQAADSAASQTPLAVVYAASDFQPKNDDFTSAQGVMESIIGQMKGTGYSKVDGALICGDYSAVYNTWNSNATNALAACNKGANAVEAVLSEQWGLTDAEVIYVQGNHDPAGVSNLDQPGANDTTHYGVYVIHEDNFQWKQEADNSGNTADAETAAKNTAAALKTYLQGKVDAKDNRPIFVCAHVPLHFGWRTVEYYDNVYAKYLFDVLNEYGKQLNIIFLFGHDHSNTYDDYLGGAAIYLPAGDKLRVPNLGSNSSSTEYTLNFTYMNAGYLGYYGGKVRDSDGTSDTGLSSTIFEIYGDKVTISRYDESSKENLKNAGVKDSSNDTWAGAAANTTVYGSNQTITLKTFKEELQSPVLSSGILTKGSTAPVSVVGLYGKSYTVEWSTSDPSIATVAASTTDSMSATITGIKAGTVKIYAKVTEVTNTRAVGDTQTLALDLEVLDVDVVTLAAAGTRTYYILDDNQDSNTWTADTSKRYVLVSQDKGNPTAGQFMAMYYNAQLDTSEGDIMGEAAWRELNAEPITVMQLPINGQIVYAVSTGDPSYQWTFRSADDMTGNYNWYYVIPTFDPTTCLMLSKGHTEANLKLYDPDNDGIRLRGIPDSGRHGSVWRMSNRGAGLTSLRTDEETDTNYYFAPYYDSVQGDISVYYTQNGDENMGQRIYLYEETTVTLANPILAYMKDTAGSVAKGVGSDAGTGDVIYIQSGDQVVTVPVTLNMLSGSFNTTVSGAYSNLTVTYAGTVITNSYTLTVHDAATLLKNEGGKFRSTIYRLVEEMVGGRHYMIVDAAEAGEAHAMGANSKNITTYPSSNSGSNFTKAAASASVSAHNILIQPFTVGGQSGLYIDSTRYSNEPDNPTDSIIVDQGNVNSNIFSATHKTAVRLVWTPSIIQTSSWPDYSSSTPINKFSNIYSADLAYRFLISEYQDGRLWISGDDKPVLYWGGSTSNEEEWKYVPTGNGSDHMQEGLVLNSSEVDNFRLFYSPENFNSSSYLNKNFITEGDNTSYDPLKRRTWLYEQVDDIDTITARMSDLEGTVTVGCNASVPTGDYILVETYLTDGTIETIQVPVRVSMLSGTLDTKTVGTYSGLTVTYEGQVISTNYTLNVVAAVPNDYPEFPDEGAVRIDKQLNTTKFNYLETGAASIDLSVTGIPSQSGVDILFVLDTSSSMTRCIHHVKQYSVEKGTCDVCGQVEENESRLALLKQTLIQTLKDLQTPINGYSPDIDVAVACFNGYTPINTDIVLDYYKKNSGDTEATSLSAATQISQDRIDSSTISLAFTNVAKLTEASMQAAADGLYLNAGTNYDRGMEIAYNLLKAKQEQAALNGETRQQILVFMSDGIPYQFNYTMGTPWMIDWDNYLKGNAVTAVPADAGAKELFDLYRNGDETLWMAEAIKGSPSQKYKIINPDLQDSKTKIDSVNGLGATIYTVGMGIYKDQRVSAEAATLVLTNIASPKANGEKYYFPCTHAEDFHDAFTFITDTVRQAGGAVFTDQMGEEFDLITSNTISWTHTNDNGTEEEKTLTFTPAPTIVVKKYELYKRSEIGTTLTFTVEAADGTTTTQTVTVTETMVGSRKPVDPVVLETVTFDKLGTEAYSDRVDVDGDGIFDTKTNIKENGVICAATFWYNDTENTVMIDTDGNGSLDTSLEKECFYWNVGDIPQDELVLSYDVYLTGSMEGTRAAGNYNTNTHAELNYDNYLDHACVLNAPIPKLPWGQATVAYGFYLVDRNGHPIINQSTGQVGSFERSVRITQPVYENFLLNSEGAETIAKDISASGVLPEGYALFDSGATYHVSLNSNGTGYYTIYTNSSTNTQTTYVVGIDSIPVTTDPNAAFDQLIGDSIKGQKTDTNSYATTNTIVWFAVTATVQGVPDTIVIDYGLPVTIDVLANDIMIGDYGTLEYVGPVSAFSSYDSSKEPLWQYLQKLEDHGQKFATTSVNGSFGTLKLLNARATGEVCYTLNSMEMNKEETFVYAVNYTGPVGTQGYYYSTVTVIPATSIYYEDSFLTYKVYDFESNVEVTDSTDSKYSNNKWSATDPNAATSSQAQDRPGEYSLPKVDANNIYGYDGAYTDMATYSMNSSMKVTVDQDAYATAEFDFWGTGFDIISLTSGDTGVIMATVYDKDTYAAYLANPKSEGNPNGVEAPTPVKSLMVDTYYGYTYGDSDGDGDHEWYVKPNASDALYQVPVLKVDLSTYGHYTAIITASYASFMDHKDPSDESGTYDFYLDAIRIYDPANDGTGNTTIENAYKADGEGWPEYFELRNLIISKNDFDSLNDSKDEVSGIVFIDGNSALTDENASANDDKADEEVEKDIIAGKIPAISDYANYGPNNELYLAPGQAIAFSLNVPKSTLAQIHLALKSVGNTAEVLVYGIDKDGNVTYALGGAGNSAQIDTATDLYYDITRLNDNTVVIMNAGESGILSITNIKATYTAAHTDFLNNSYFTVSQPVANAALTSLLTVAAEVSTKPDAFLPQHFDVRLLPPQYEDWLHRGLYC